jgi:purine nucleosidase/pyrimidine-specific ribonucleoside hydrolase
MCGLDVTHQALATEDVLARLRALGTPLADTVVDLLGFFAQRYRALWGFPAAPVHDPVAVARVIAPEVVGCVAAHVAVELHGTHTRGATVVDRFGVTGEAPNAQVALTLDHAGFWGLVLDAVGTLGARRAP